MIVFYFIASIPAVIVIGIWAAIQIANTYGALFATGQTGGVAYMAHVGGLVVGVMMGFVARALLKEEPDTVLRRQYEHDPRAKRLW